MQKIDFQTKSIFDKLKNLTLRGILRRKLEKLKNKPQMKIASQPAF